MTGTREESAIAKVVSDRLAGFNTFNVDSGARAVTRVAGVGGVLVVYRRRENISLTGFAVQRTGPLIAAIECFARINGEVPTGGGGEEGDCGYEEDGDERRLHHGEGLFEYFM